MRRFNMDLQYLIEDEKEVLQGIGLYDKINSLLQKAYKCGVEKRRVSHDFEITQAVLKEYFDYREDGFLVWKKKRNTSSAKIGSIAGSQDKKTKYRHINIGAKTILLHRAIFLWHKGYLPKVVDHKDRDPGNCRIGNLRDATPSQNSQNRNVPYGKYSKYRGVSFNKDRRGRQWSSTINTGCGKIICRDFNTEIEAALNYNKLAVLHHKEFANLNICIPA